MVTKRSHMLKQTCTFQLQVCLSMRDLFVGTRHWRVKPNKSYNTLVPYTTAFNAWKNHLFEDFALETFKKIISQLIDKKGYEDKKNQATLGHINI